MMLFLAAGATSGMAQIAVITHRSVPVDELDRRGLTDIYTMVETKWDGGSPLTLIDLKGNSEVKQAFYRFLGYRPDDLKRIWLRLVLSGEVRSPTLLASPEDVLEKVASTPGAIGYVPARLVSQDVNVVAMIR